MFRFVLYAHVSLFWATNYGPRATNYRQRLLGQLSRVLWGRWCHLLKPRPTLQKSAASQSTRPITEVYPSFQMRSSSVVKS